MLVGKEGFEPPRSQHYSQKVLSLDSSFLTIIRGLPISGSVFILTSLPIDPISPNLISGMSLLLTTPDSIATIFNMSRSSLGTIRIAKCKY